MLPKTRVIILISILLGLSLACAAPVLAVTPTIQPDDVFSATETVVMVPSETVLPSSETAVASATPFDPSLTPTAAQTETPITFPGITFERNTNCRLGPALNYFVATSFLRDRSTIAEGRNADSSWLWVRSRDPNVRCWVSVANIKNPESYAFLPVTIFPALPEAPANLYVDTKNCGARNVLILKWSPISRETGFRFYRNGIMLASIKTNATSYTDFPSNGREYFYEIESINNNGISVRAALSVPGCLP